MNGRLLAAGLAAMTLFVGGCVVAPAHPHPVERVHVAPPPPYVEYVGHPPHVGWIWIGGYWNWIGVRYVWVPGRWEAPRHGHRWVPHRWERDGEHWRRHGGHWERERHAPSHRDWRDDRRGDDGQRHDFRPAPHGAPAFGERREVRPSDADGSRRMFHENRRDDGPRERAGADRRREEFRPRGEDGGRRQGGARLDRSGAPAAEGRVRSQAYRERPDGDARRERGREARSRDDGR